MNYITKVYIVRGLIYYDFDDKKDKKGHKLKLIHEPSNSTDPNAIKIITKDGRKIGYIGRDETAPLHKSKFHGCKFESTIHVVDPHAPLWRKVAIKVKVTCPRSKAPIELEF
jgi:hypothetical protein